MDTLQDIELFHGLGKDIWHSKMQLAESKVKELVQASHWLMNQACVVLIRLFIWNDLVLNLESCMTVPGTLFLFTVLIINDCYLEYLSFQSATFNLYSLPVSDMQILAIGFNIN